MWDINGGIIQLELGDNVVKTFSTSKKKFCDILISQVQEFRQNLHNNEGVILPTIDLRNSTELYADEFCVYFGNIRHKENYNHISIFDIIYYYLKKFKIDDYSYQGVLNIFNRGTNHLTDDNIQNALVEFCKAYYCASFDSDAYPLMIMSIINCCAISAFNGCFDDAILAAQKACVLASNNGFYDPKIKHSAYTWLATLNLKTNNNKDALDNLITAYNYISETDYNELKLISLISISNIALDFGDTKLCSEALKYMRPILKMDNLSLNKDGYNCVIELYSNLAKSLQEENTELRHELNFISKKFLVKFGEAIIASVRKTGPLLLNSLIVGLVSGNTIIGNGGTINNAKGNIFKLN